MATTTPLQAIPIPSATDAADVPNSFSSAFVAAEKKFVMVFASAAARATAITSPTEGMLTWLQDLNRYETYDGSSWVPLVSVSAWTSFTPVFAAFTLGNGTAVGSYLQTGKMIDWRLKITWGSTTTTSGGPSVNLPVGSANHAGDIYPEAWGLFQDISPAATYAAIQRVTSTSCIFMYSSTTSGQLTNVSTTAPFTFAAGDLIFLNGRYELA